MTSTLEQPRPTSRSAVWDRVHGLKSHLRLAARTLSRRPTFTLVALVTLGLGIGSTTAIFSIFDTVVLKPLPFYDPGRLVVVWTTAPGQGLRDGAVSYPDFKDWSEQSRGFDGLATVWTFPNGDVNLTGGVEPKRVSVARISTGFFEVLGVKPYLGRTFLPEESVAGSHRRAILSYGLWQREFGGDSTLVGRNVMVNGFAYDVVGVMPQAVSARSISLLGTDVQLWRPLVPNDNQTGGRDERKLRVVGRLAAGNTLPQAESDLATVAAKLAQDYPESNREIGVRLVPLHQQAVGDVRRSLLFLLGAVAVVLAGACANVANLLLIKTAATRNQTALRQALGAAKAHLFAPVFAESFLLGLGGAALGIALSWLTVKAVVALGPADIPMLADARIDVSVMSFAIAASLATVFLVGIVPAWRTTRNDVNVMLRQGSTRTHGRDDRRVMGVLMGAQVALAMLLLTGSATLLRSFEALMRVDLGITPEHVLTYKLEVPMGAGMPYASQSSRDGFFATLLDRTRALPGVAAVTFANAPPLEDEPRAFTFSRPGVSDSRDLRADFRLVGVDYFTVLGIPMVRGRPFDATDGRTSPRVAIVSQSLSRYVWGQSDPVGQRIELPFGGEATVVGVAGDVRTTGLDGDPARTVYVPALQGGFNFMTLVVKSTTTDPGKLVPEIRSLVRELDASLPLYQVNTLETLVNASVARQRFQTILVTVFSALVLILAVVATYGVSSFGVSERAGEIGIRAALGATARDIIGLVMSESARVVLVGVLVGGILAAAVSQLLSRFIFQASTLDRVALVSAPLVLLAAVFFATYFPARRASRAEPMRTLRAD
jgi:putative ABC transport system permease protein